MGLWPLTVAELDELDELTCPLTEQKPPNPQDIVSNRSGQVLIRDTILKSDHFPGCQNISLTPLLDGAPNFRQVTTNAMVHIRVSVVRVEPYV